MDARAASGWRPEAGDAGALPGAARTQAGELTDRPAIAAGLGWLPLASLLVTADGSALAVNAAWASLSGLDPDESSGEGWLDAVEPLDRSALHARLRRAAASGEAGSADCTLLPPSGRRRSRWWWRPDSGGDLIVCVAAMGDGPQEPASQRRSLRAPLPGTALDPAGTDLATNVIHRIFGVGLILESAAGMIDGEAASRLQRAVAELDTLIIDVRSAVLGPLTSFGQA